MKKRILGLILSLYGLNVVAQSFNWYTGPVSIDINDGKKSEILDALASNGGRDFNNVAVIEYLSHLKYGGWGYHEFIDYPMNVKIDFVRGFFSWLSVPAVSGGFVPVFVSSGVLQKYIDLVMINASNIEILNNLDTNSEFNNLAVVEYLLLAKFGFKPGDLDRLGMAKKMDSLRQRLLSTVPISASSEAKAAAGLTATIAGAADASGADKYDVPVLERYIKMIKDGVENVKILQSLMAPERVEIVKNPLTDKYEVDLSDNLTKKTLTEVVPVNSRQDINNMKVVDYLLHTKFYQPFETIDKMYPYFKIVDLKRQLLPYYQRNFYMSLPEPDNGEDANFPNQSVVKPRDQKFSRCWIEFPSSSRPRHLDYSTGGDSVFLMNSEVFFTDRNDYQNINQYAPRGYVKTPTQEIVNYYWAKDGDSFLLVFRDGSSQRYGWEFGEPLGEPIEHSIELIEISDDSKKDDSASASEDDSASASADDTAAAAKKPTGFRQMEKESNKHFMARRAGILNPLGTGLERDPVTMAIGRALQALDSEEFNLINDHMIEALQSPDRFLPDLDIILAKDPKSADIFEKAKVYVAIKAPLINVDPGPDRDPRIDVWEAALNKIDLDSSRAIDVGVSSNILRDSLEFDPNTYGQALSKFTLNSEQQGLLARPANYLRFIGRFLKQNPETADEFTAAKIFMALGSGFIHSNENENPDVIKWRNHFLGIYT